MRILLAPLSILLLSMVGCGSSELQRRLAEVEQQLEEARVTLSTVRTGNPALIHSVFFWLKEGVSQEELGDFIEGCRKLGTIESVRSCYVGPPAATPDRDVVDHSYSVALIVHFNDLAAHEIYQEHPAHQEFINTYSDLWEKVQVFDNRVE
jgi:hypothetical protein